MENNINNVITNALAVKKSDLNKKIKTIIEQIKKAIIDNKDLIIQANEIDKNKDNGFIIDFDVIDNIFDLIDSETILFGDVTLSQKDDDKKLIYGKQIMDVGNVVVINDGNTYVLIEMILRNILAGNTAIYANNGYMYGTNNLLVQIIQDVLEHYDISRNLVQNFVTDDFDIVLNNFANINLVVCIGDNELQNIILKSSRNKTIVSGYEHFDLYIEDTTHLDFLNNIMNTGLDIKLYINENTNIDYQDAMIVSDIDEAIGQINYTGSGYSAAIFTTSTKNASLFMKEVRSKIVTVNTSPTIERIIDIKQRDLVNEKTLIYPLTFKLDGTTINIER